MNAEPAALGTKEKKISEDRRTKSDEAAYHSL